MGQLFREHQIDVTRVNYFNEPFSIDKLTALISKTGLKPFEILRKNESIAKQLNLTKETPDKAVIEAMVKNPNLIQRPIVEVGNKAILARPIERVLELIDL